MVGATALSTYVMHNGSHYCFFAFLYSSATEIQQCYPLYRSRSVVFFWSEKTKDFSWENLCEKKRKGCDTLLRKELRKRVSNFYYSLNTSKTVCVSLCWQWNITSLIALDSTPKAATNLFAFSFKMLTQLILYFTRVRMALQRFSLLELQAGKCTSVKQQSMPPPWGGFWREGVMHIWSAAPFSGNGSSHTFYTWPVLI